MKQNCIFENCLFGRHESLSCEREHIRYYFEEIIGMDELTLTQIRIFEALSPIWTGMILEKMYEDLGWKNQTELINVLKVDQDLVVYNKDRDDEHLLAEWNMENIRVDKAVKREMIEKRKERTPKYLFKKRADSDKEKVHNNLRMSCRVEWELTHRVLKR
jgi:hypothetical protein